MNGTITLPRSVVEQALKALEKADRISGYRNNWAAVNSLIAALEQPQVKQEPVEYWTVANGWVSEQAEVPAAAWVYPEFWDHCKNVGCGTAYRQPGSGRQPLYTCPQPKREPLTAEQIADIEDMFSNEFGLEAKHAVDFARAIERAHGIGGDA